MELDKAGYDRLVRRIGEADHDALSALYEQIKTPVYALALAILRDTGEAEDVMQNTFIRVWECAGQYRPGTDARAWILKIAKNLALGTLRRQKRAGIVPLEAVAEATEPDPITPLLDRLLLDKLLSTLDEAERQIVLLHATAGYTHQEIAAILGRPAATVRWKYSQAIHKLSEQAEGASPLGERVLRLLPGTW